MSPVIREKCVMGTARLVIMRQIDGQILVEAWVFT